MEKRYTALRIIATLYKIVGVILGILTLLGAVFIVIARPVIDFGFGNLGLDLGLSLVAAITEVVAGGLTALGIFAVGELISLLINIEENTRFTALVVRDRLQPPPGQPAAQPPYQPPYQPPAQQVYPAPVPPPYQPPIPPQSQTPTNQPPPPYQPPQS